MLLVPDANAAPTHELLAMFDTVPFNYLMSEYGMQASLT